MPILKVCFVIIFFDHVDFVCDTRKLTMIEDNSVSEIYACHILEHVERNEVVSVLREWNRDVRMVARGAG